MARPRLHDDGLRTRLVDRAGEILCTEGVEALGLRRLAADVGTSTSAVYGLLGGKPGLLATLAEAAAARMRARLAAPPATGDADEDLVRRCLAYRAAALADPHGYRLVMSSASTAAEVGAGLPAALWATVHGLVSLELRGLLPEAVFEDTVRAVVRGRAGAASG